MIDIQGIRIIVGAVCLAWGMLSANPISLLGVMACACW